MNFLVPKMMVRKIDVELSERIETGPVQFGDDWPGVFIRGDNALYLCMMLKSHLAGSKDFASELAMKNLANLLESCNIVKSRNEKE